MIVRARSPYMIFINEAGQTSGKLELRIWKKGETKPTLPTYSFTKSIPSPTQTLLRFNISPYLKDFISNKLNDVNTWYCNFECRLFSNNVELTAKKVEGIAVNGYTTFLQGQNATGTAQDLKNSIDNLQIGGRNLIKNSELKGVISGSPSLELSEPLIAGQECTLSFTAKKEASNSDVGWVSEQRFNDWTAEQLNVRVSVTDSEYKEYKATFIAKSTAIEQKIWVYSADSYKIDLKKGIKLEKGNKATDWTPAPEDEQYRFSYIKRQIKV